jgi:hypothetical protein
MRCQPVRSLRARRGLVGWCAAALAVGVLLWLIGESRQADLLSPGDLTFQHGTVTQSCSACHGDPGDTLETVLAAAARGHDGIDESQRCLNCHQLGMNALSPHGLAPTAFERVAGHIGKVVPTLAPPFLLTAARLGPGVPGMDEGKLACAVCHHEHKGKNVRLAQMDNQSCQACHSQPFSSFADGHPEFAGYPYHERTHLNFDHVSHLGRHFEDVRRHMPNVTAPGSCLDCHQQGPAGRLMLVKSFEQTCAQCHLHQIEDTTLGGIPFLNVPAIDVNTIRQREAEGRWLDPLLALGCWPGSAALPLGLAGALGRRADGLSPPIAIGDWPASASSDLSPFMHLLLSADERFTGAEAKLRGQDLRDLRRANVEQVKAVEQYAWAIKELFYELIHEGPPALHARLEKGLNRRLTHHEQSSFSGDLPLDLLQKAQERWWPGLDAEVEAHRLGKPLPAPLKNLPPEAPTTKATLLGPPSRWYRNDGSFSLSYRPKGHAGDFMRSWLDLGARSVGPEANANVSAIFTALSDPFAPGRCLKCHGIESDRHQCRIHWLGIRPVPNEHKFTRYAHVTHFSLLGPKGCQTCHVLNEKADFAVGFVRKDYSANSEAHVFQSNFQTMDRAVCASCHTSRAAGDSCLTCHNYHVGILPPAMPNAPLPERRSPEK